MPSVVKSAFDIAFWFADTALNENEYLQPQKLQRLLFLAQAYHLAAFDGKKLMPAVFVADEMGPMEPNVYAAFSNGRPDLDVDMFLPDEVENLLTGVWRKFGHLSIDRLNKVVKDTLAFKQARRRGPRAEIPTADMRRSFARRDETPSVGTVVKPRLLRTQSGRTVTVKTWAPAAVKPAKGGAAPKIIRQPPQTK